MKTVIKHKKSSKLNIAFKKVEREHLCKLQNYSCYYCKTPITITNATLDHIIPISECGGYHSYSNCVASCEKCNQEKGNKSVEEFEASRVESNKSSKSSLVSNDPDELRFQQLLEEMLERIDMRARLAVWRLSFNPKGSFKKWLKYHTKNRQV